MRPGRTAKDAIRSLLAVPGLRQMWAYKVDISNYFNSIPVLQLLPMLREAVGEADGLVAAAFDVVFVENRQDGLAAGAEVGEYLLDGFDLFLDARMGGVDDVHEQVGLVDFFERRLEGFDEMVRELADEADGIGQQAGLAAGEGDLARGRV